jgi:hypothetical protein
MFTDFSRYISSAWGWGSLFPQNVSNHLPIYTASHTGWQKQWQVTAVRAPNLTQWQKNVHSHCRDVFPGEGIRGVADQQTCLTNRTARKQNTALIKLHSKVVPISPHFTKVSGSHPSSLQTFPQSAEAPQTIPALSYQFNVYRLLLLQLILWHIDPFLGKD